MKAYTYKFRGKVVTVAATQSSHARRLIIKYAETLGQEVKNYELKMVGTPTSIKEGAILYAS